MKKLLLGLMHPPGRLTLPGPARPRAASVHSILASTQRETAIFASDMMGAQTYIGEFGAPIDPSRTNDSLFRDVIEHADDGYMIIDPRPGLHIVDINEMYGSATLTRAAQIAGRKLFDVFPDNPDLDEADGVSNLFQSIRHVARSGRPHHMPVQRYDVRDAHGRFVERSWRCVNIPILDEHGRLVYILHQARELPATGDHSVTEPAFV